MLVMLGSTFLGTAEVPRIYEGAFPDGDKLLTVFNGTPVPAFWSTPLERSVWRRRLLSQYSAILAAFLPFFGCLAKSLSARNLPAEFPRSPSKRHEEKVR